MRGRPVPLNNPIISCNPILIESVEDLHEVCSSMAKATICKGNDDSTFVNLLESKGGVAKNVSGAVIAKIDVTQSHSTVRHHNCNIISNAVRCGVCENYRPTLRAMLSRSKRTNETAKTGSDSHTNYRYLQADELKCRLRNVQRAKRIAERTIIKLKQKINSNIDQDGIDLSVGDAQELDELFTETDETVSKKFAKEHFQRIFWEQQRAYNNLSNKCSMRWHPLMIRFALNLKYLSGTAYRSVRNFLALPTQRTLCDYTHVMSVDVGISSSVMKRLKNDINYEGSGENYKVGILMDEMKIKSGLVFNKKLGKIVGFVNLGSVNSDLKAMEESLSDDTAHKYTPELATSMLVVMVRSIIKPSFSFPVARYPTTSLSGEKLYPLAWEVIEALEMNDLPVYFITCDGLSANRKFFRLSMNVNPCPPFSSIYSL